MKKADPIYCLHQSNYDGITASNLESRGNVISSSIEPVALVALLSSVRSAVFQNAFLLEKCKALGYLFSIISIVSRPRGGGGVLG